MKKVKLLILPFLLIVFSLFFMATSKQPICDRDCSAVVDVGTALRNGRTSYVEGVYRCGYSLVSDTLCVYVKDTTGIDWDRLADTTCMIAAQRGLSGQKIFILKNFSYPTDTVARKNCP
jgi:hypothetical protein